MSGFICEPLARTCGDIYARMKAHVIRRGRSLHENDLWIAASAYALEATLVTFDLDFEYIASLRLLTFDVN